MPTSSAPRKLVVPTSSTPRSPTPKSIRATASENRWLERMHKGGGTSPHKHPTRSTSRTGTARESDSQLASRLRPPVAGRTLARTPCRSASPAVQLSKHPSTTHAMSPPRAQRQLSPRCGVQLLPDAVCIAALFNVDDADEDVVQALDLAAVPSDVMMATEVGFDGETVESRMSDPPAVLPEGGTPSASREIESGSSDLAALLPGEQSMTDSEPCTIEAPCNTMTVAGSLANALAFVSSSEEHPAESLAATDSLKATPAPDKLELLADTPASLRNAACEALTPEPMQLREQLAVGSCDEGAAPKDQALGSSDLGIQAKEAIISAARPLKAAIRAAQCESERKDSALEASELFEALQVKDCNAPSSPRSSNNLADAVQEGHQHEVQPAPNQPEWIEQGLASPTPFQPQVRQPELRDQLAQSPISQCQLSLGACGVDALTRDEQPQLPTADLSPRSPQQPLPSHLSQLESGEEPNSFLSASASPSPRMPRHQLVTSAAVSGGLPRPAAPAAPSRRTEVLERFARGCAQQVRLLAQNGQAAKVAAISVGVFCVLLGGAELAWRLGPEPEFFM